MRSRRDVAEMLMVRVLSIVPWNAHVPKNSSADLLSDQKSPKPCPHRVGIKKCTEVIRLVKGIYSRRVDLVVRDNHLVRDN